MLDAHGDAVARVDRLKLFGPAHARLIAAAPDLLAALQAAIPGLETLADADRAGWQPHLIAARAAIAKAKGDLS